MAEVYEMVYKCNIGVIIKAMLWKILKSDILPILCIDSKLLNNCLNPIRCYIKTATDGRYDKLTLVIWVIRDY